MLKSGIIKPMKFGHSMLLFLLPGLYAVFAFYVFMPFLIRLGLSAEIAYGTQMLSVFLLLIIAAVICLKRDGWPLTWATARDRLRIKSMDSEAWKWTLIFLFLIAVKKHLSIF